MLTRKAKWPRGALSPLTSPDPPSSCPGTGWAPAGAWEPQAARAGVETQVEWRPGVRIPVLTSPRRPVGSSQGPGASARHSFPACPWQL